VKGENISLSKGNPVGKNWGEFWLYFEITDIKTGQRMKPVWSERRLGCGLIATVTVRPRNPGPT
jgi:hypothetical protein